MALPASDGFAGTDGQALTTYSASWSLNSGNFAVYSPAGETDLRSNAAAAECGARWNADTFLPNQYAQCVVPAISGAGNACGVAVRLNTSGAASYYGCYVDGDTTSCFIFKMVTGTWTQIGTTRAAPAAGSVLRLSVVGDKLRAYDDGVQMGATETDTSLTTGAAGVSGFGNSTAIRIDSWEGGNAGITLATDVGLLTATGFAPSVSTVGSTAATLGGSILSATTETDIVSGAKVITLEVFGTTWVP